MTFTTTGLAHSLTSLGLIFCAFWFFKAFQHIGGLRSGRPLGILLSLLALGIAFNQSLFALGSLFFVKNPEAFYAIIVVANLVSAITAALGVYLAFYVLLPKFSPWPATIIVLIYGLFVTTLLLITHPQPFITPNGSVDYGISRSVKPFFYYLWLITVGSPFLIFTKNFFSAVSKDVKMVSLIIVLATIFGFINTSVYYFSGIFKFIDDVRVFAYDGTLSIVGILLIMGFLIIPIVRGWIGRSAENTTSQKSDSQKSDVRGGKILS